MKLYQQWCCFVLYAVSVEEQSIKDSQHVHHDGFDCSSDFSFVFCEISRCLKKDLPKVKRLQRYLDYFSHPKHKHRRYVKRKVYKGARSTRGILDALFPKYISATDIKLLQCIVKEYGCQRCQRILENYAKKHPRTSWTCTSYMITYPCTVANVIKLHLLNFFWDSYHSFRVVVRVLRLGLT